MSIRPVMAHWRGPRIDMLTVLVIDAITTGYEASLDFEEEGVVYYRALDESDEADTADEATGEIVGIEIDDFLTFDHWSALQPMTDLWQLGDREALIPVLLLLDIQRQLRLGIPLKRDNAAWDLIWSQVGLDGPEYMSHRNQGDQDEQVDQDPFQC